MPPSTTLLPASVAPVRNLPRKRPPANQRLQLAATWAEQENGDFVNVDDPMAMEPLSIVYDASGLEVYGSFDLTERFRLTGGRGQRWGWGSRR